MTTNIQGTRPTTLADDRPVVEPIPTPVVVPTSAGGVAVYDRPGDGTTSPSMHPSASLLEDPAPVETRSGMSIFTWIISAIVLIVLAYFLLQVLS